MTEKIPSPVSNRNVGTAQVPEKLKEGEDLDELLEAVVWPYGWGAEVVALECPDMQRFGLSAQLKNLSSKTTRGDFLKNGIQQI